MGYSKAVPYCGDKLCSKGCGQPAKFEQKSGEFICQSHYRNCPNYKATRAAKFKEKFGYESIMHNPEFQKKIQLQNIQNFGVATPFERKDILKKAQETCLQHLGVKNPFASAPIKEKIKITNLGRYGVENPSGNQEVKQKKIDTCKKNFGVTNPTKSPALQSKARQTNLVKYGAPHPMQNRGIAYKALKHGLQRREFQLPSGETVFLSGYEPYILDELLRTGLQESDFDFSLSKFPSFTYTNENGNPSKYIPDFFVPRLRWIIEVKSTYTFTLEKTRNLAKYHACRAAGYQMNFIVRRARGKLLLLTELPPRSGKSPQYNPNAIP